MRIVRAHRAGLSGGDHGGLAAGDDTITGGGGHDVLVGGDDSDRLVGGAGHDVLAAGAFDCVVTAGALRELGATWATTRTVADELAEEADEVLTDLDIDRLTGSSGADWFLVSRGDRITDRSRNSIRQGDVVTYVG